MISLDGFDDPLHDAAGEDPAADHDLLDHDALDQDALDRAAYDPDDPGAGPAGGEELTAIGPDGERIDLGPADVSSTGDPDPPGQHHRGQRGRHVHRGVHRPRR